MTAVPTAPPPDVEAALRAVRRRTEVVPEIALVLGSGLGALAEEVEEAVALSTAEVPGYPRSTVQGHAGRLVLGTLEGRQVLFVQGRAHLYEGHAPSALGFPVRLAHALGARRLLVTNAAGGINPRFKPGTLMFITDHLSAAFASPLSGPDAFPVAANANPRAVPRPAEAYDAAWTNRAEAVALRERIATRRGVYLWTGGPSYETKAEVQAFARLGADAVGMSTVPEVLQARHLGMSVLGLSTITNPAAGIGAEPLRHDDVLRVGERVRASLSHLVRGILRETLGTA